MDKHHGKYKNGGTLMIFPAKTLNFWLFGQLGWSNLYTYKNKFENTLAGAGDWTPYLLHQSLALYQLLLSYYWMVKLTQFLSDAIMLKRTTLK